MIRLDASTFARATVKAQTVKPAVVRTELGYAVRRSDNGLASVRFVARDGAIWATCDCPAHQPMHGPKREPRPCYHIAAAFLWSLSTRQPKTHAQPAQAFHYHECHGCGLNYPCPSPACEHLHELACDHCDAREADALSYDLSFTTH